MKHGLSFIMKIGNNLSIIFIFLFGLVLLGCSNKINVSNKVFIEDNSLTSYKLEFLNDSLCVYDQKFLCDVTPPYNKIKIKCRYHIVGKKIILENLSTHPDSISKTCFIIPDEAFVNCDPIIKDSEEKEFSVPPQLKLIEIYCYINNITLDTLTYKRGKINYVKIIDCAPFSLLRTHNFKEEKFNKP